MILRVEVDVWSSLRTDPEQQAGLLYIGSLSSDSGGQRAQRPIHSGKKQLASQSKSGKARGQKTRREKDCLRHRCS